VTQERNLIDPSDILPIDCPVIVLVDDLTSFWGWAIKSHSQGNYNHAMIMYRPGWVASQDLCGYRKRPITDYLQPHIILKFWKPFITGQEKEAIIKKILADLKKPWWSRMYDLLGIAGQAIHIRWLQNPWKRYCSERVAEDLMIVDSLKNIFPKRPSPSGLNNIFNQNTGQFKLLGYIIPED
jgi:hypothetical protein